MRTTKHPRELVLALPCDYGEADGWGLRVISPSEDGCEVSQEVLCLGCCEHAAKQIAPQVQSWLREEGSDPINIAALRERLIGICTGLLIGQELDHEYCPACEQQQ